MVKSVVWPFIVTVQVSCPWVVISTDWILFPQLDEYSVDLFGWWSISLIWLFYDFLFILKYYQRRYSSCTIFDISEVELYLLHRHTINHFPPLARSFLCEAAVKQHVFRDSKSPHSQWSSSLGFIRWIYVGYEPYPTWKWMNLWAFCAFIPFLLSLRHNCFSNLILQSDMGGQDAFHVLDFLSSVSIWPLFSLAQDVVVEFLPPFCKECPMLKSLTPGCTKLD